jgi:hypothetical protein
MSARTIEVPCLVDIEQTQEFFHAHAIPDGIEIRPGDSVIVHDVPAVGFGEHITMRCRATVTRGTWLDRVLAQAGGLLELTSLYEVGFEPAGFLDERDH